MSWDEFRLPGTYFITDFSFWQGWFKPRITRRFIEIKAYEETRAQVVKLTPPHKRAVQQAIEDVEFSRLENMRAGGYALAGLQYETLQWLKGILDEMA